MRTHRSMSLQVLLSTVMFAVFFISLYLVHNIEVIILKFFVFICIYYNINILLNHTITYFVIFNSMLRDLMY